jgi:hypothetical protein
MEIQQRQENVEGNQIPTPLIGLALHHFNRNLLAVFQFVLDRQGYFGLDAVDARLVLALSRQDYATLLLRIATGAQRILNCD